MDFNKVSTENANKSYQCSPGQISMKLKDKQMVYLPGTTALDPRTQQVAKGTVKDRTRQAFWNLSATLEKAGTSLRNVVVVYFFITTMDNADTMCEVFTEFFTWDPKPHCRCFAVKLLPTGSDVEVDCAAFVEDLE